MTKKGFMVAVSEYFGKNGRSLAEFKKEIDQLTDKDRADLAPLLGAALGCEVDPSRSPVSPAPSAEPVASA